MNNGVAQLEKVTLRYCKQGGSSRGMRYELLIVDLTFFSCIHRGFIAERLMPFAVEHPKLKWETTIRNGKHPIVIGQFICGSQKQIDCRGKDERAITKIIDGLRQQSGRKQVRLDKPTYSLQPSIQGYWQPFQDYQTHIVDDDAPEAEQQQETPPLAASS